METEEPLSARRWGLADPVAALRLQSQASVSARPPSGCRQGWSQGLATFPGWGGAGSHGSHRVPSLSRLTVHGDQQHVGWWSGGLGFWNTGRRGGMAAWVRPPQVSEQQ